MGPFCLAVLGVVAEGVLVDPGHVVSGVEGDAGDLEDNSLLTVLWVDSLADLLEVDPASVSIRLGVWPALPRTPERAIYKDPA